MKTAQILEIVSCNPENLNNKQLISTVSRSYNAGAISILKEVANGKLTEFEESNQLDYSAKTKAQHDKVLQVYRKLQEKTEGDPELQKLILQYDTEECDWQSMAGTDLFIQGFLEGYKFLQRTRGEVAIETKKE